MGYALVIVDSICSGAHIQDTATYVDWKIDNPRHRVEAFQDATEQVESFIVVFCRIRKVQYLAAPSHRR